MHKKIYFVCAPIFLHWPVAISKKIASFNNGEIVTGGFIGGPRKYHTILKDEWGKLADEVVYTHDLEKLWINEEYKREDLEFFTELLGHKVINELIIADRHIGHGLLSGGNVASAQFLIRLQTDKTAYLNYIINMLRYIYDFFSKQKPDLIYSYAVAGSFTLAIAEIAKALNITFTKLTHSRIDNKIVIDTDERDGMDRVRIKYSQSIDSFSKESIDFGTTYLENFRSKQHQPDYQILQNNIYLSKTKLKYQLKLIAKYIKGKINRSNEFFHTSYIGNISYEQKVVRGIKRFWKERPFYNADKLIEKPFLFYPLHVDPEASTMVISPYQTNQFAVLEAIAKAKAINHILIVKEHLTMIGRRPKGFYDRINALPGVYMVDPNEPSFNFINNAQAVITLTGTAGLEAVLLQKPAIFLGNFIYKFIEKGFVLTNDLSQLTEILTNLNNIKPADDTILIKLLAAIDEVSFPFDGGLIWSGVSKERVSENPEIVEKFASELNNLLNQ